MYIVYLYGKNMYKIKYFHFHYYNVLFYFIDWLRKVIYVSKIHFHIHCLQMLLIYQPKPIFKLLSPLSFNFILSCRMTGYEAEDAGIIPRFCKELFQRIQTDQIVSVPLVMLKNTYKHIFFTRHAP